MARNNRTHDTDYVRFFNDSNKKKLTQKHLADKLKHLEKRLAYYLNPDSWRDRIIADIKKQIEDIKRQLKDLPSTKL